MAKFTDLPDEILTMILVYFKPSVQDNGYIRYLSDVEPADIAKRANLASLARLNKRVSAIAGSLLNEKPYLYLDMRSPKAHLAKLALLSKCRTLQQLICKIPADQTDGFLTCLASISAPANLQGLCVSLEAAGTRPIDLQSLARLPELQGLALRFDTNSRLLVPPSSSLPCLRELRISNTATFAQTASALSLAPTQTLQILDLFNSRLEGPPGSTDLWAHTLGHKRFNQVYELRIMTSRSDGIPSAVMREARKRFPALEDFEVIYTRSASFGCDKRLLSLPKNVTGIQISPPNLKELRLLLLSITKDIQLETQLQAIHIETGDLTTQWKWRGVNRSETIQLSRDARQVTLSRGIELEPLDLTEKLERLPV